MNEIRQQVLYVEQIDNINEISNIPPHRIEYANWNEFPNGPLTVFRIARLRDELAIKFTVTELNPRSINTKDLDPVWEDSCVEFFCKMPDENYYFNFEFNSKGVCVASSRLAQNEGIRFLIPDQLSSIKRYPSIEKDSWSLTILIPINIICPYLKYPLILKGNFYKCGDKTPHPHFLSWNPIETPSPLFHCPQFFGNIIVK